MVKIDATCYLKGDDFSEKTILDNTNLILHSIKTSKKNDNLQIRKYGKVVSIIPSENGIFEDDYSDLLKNFTKLIEKQKDSILACGCEKIILYLEIKYTDQCNFEFDSKILESISNNFDDLHITCYDTESY